MPFLCNFPTKKVPDDLYLNLNNKNKEVKTIQLTASDHITHKLDVLDHSKPFIHSSINTNDCNLTSIINTAKQGQSISYVLQNGEHNKGKKVIHVSPIMERNKPIGVLLAVNKCNGESNEDIIKSNFITISK